MPYPRHLINEGETVALDLHPHWWYFSKHILTGIPLFLALIGVLTLSGSVRRLRVPVGKRRLARVNTDEALWFDIIGIVEHQRRVTLAAEGREAMFFAEGHIGPGAAGRWVVRTDGDPARLIPVIRSELARLDSTLSSIGRPPKATRVRPSSRPSSPSFLADW